MATAATAYDDRQMSIGRVFERAFATIAHNPLVVLAIAIVLGGIPSAIVNYLSQAVRGGMLASGSDRAAMWGAMLFSWIVSIVIGAIVQGAMTRATVAEGENQRAGFAECLAAGARVFLPLIGVALIFGFVIFLGFIFLIVPGIIVMVMWSVAAPAVVVERDGVFRALSRSQELTRGFRWKIFGLFLVLLVIYVLLFSVLGVVGLSSMRAAAATGAFSTVNFVASVITSVLVHLLWGTIQPSLYVELRRANNGDSIESLEQIFA
jgi:MFS family permease